MQLIEERQLAIARNIRIGTTLNVRSRGVAVPKEEGSNNSLVATPTK